MGNRLSWARAWGCSLLLAAAVGLPACTTARIGQFERFADAGVAYAGAVDALSLEAVNAAVDADSAVLARARGSLTVDERARTVLEHNDLLRQRVELMRDLQRHAALLQGYFLGLAALAESDAADTIAAETESLAESIEVLGARIRNESVGGEPLGDLAGAAAGIAVARFQREALEHELRARAALLERELELQRVAMEAIADELRTDLTAILGQRELEEVVEPYRSSSSSLPRSWAQRRREILAATTAADSVDAAASAAAGLKRSFRALVENHYTLADYRAVLSDVNAIITLLEYVRALDADG
jgi:signal transduction histidine kinase